MTLSLGGLEAGKSYRLQLWVNDSRYDILYNRVEVDGGGNKAEIKTNLASASGGIGQYVIGTFAATSTNQDVSFIGLTDVDGINYYSRNPIVNTFQLRLESSGEVPEPASMVIFGLGALGLACRKRRRTIV